MPNENGWYNKAEVLETGLPYYIPASKRWTSEPYPFAVLLTKSRCKEFGVPILPSGREKPCAFRYSSPKGLYYPLYDRTSVFLSGELSIDHLYDHEIMGMLPARNGRELINPKI